jgi:sulfite exporter TauE/SafE/copper chaperone CopZ
MSENTANAQLSVSGMTCGGCEARIERRLKALGGVTKAKASYAGGKVGVAYDADKVSLAEIKRTVTALGYTVLDRPAAEKAAPLQWAASAVVLLGVFVLLRHFGVLDFFNYFPEARAGMGYAAVLALGALSSVHCIGMCGGVNLSQCVGAGGVGKGGRMRPSLLYNSGRVVSYTVIGAIVGAAGATVSFNGVMRGAVALFAGAFMVVMGLNTLNIFPWLRRLRLRLPRFLTGGLQGRNAGPFYVGLLNGLMPCGPLQAMQLYALSTGSAAQGAVSMFLFALGTSPLMFGLGAVSAALSKRFAAKMTAVSAVLVVLLGLGMFNTGVNMSGFLSFGTETSDTSGFAPVMRDGYQLVEIDVSPNGYAPVTVKKGTPVRFNLKAESGNLNGCNNAIIIPKYGVQKSLKPGDNVVEFTPEETGIVPYSCWMNMIRSSITVVD